MLSDTIINNSRYINLDIIAQRKVDRIDLYTKTKMNFEALTVNGQTAYDFEYVNGNTYNAFTKRWSENLCTYHVTNNEALQIEMQFPKDSLPEFLIYESSYDLLQNDQFTIPERARDMIPRPFILNDAVITKKKWNITEYVEKIIDTIAKQEDSIPDIKVHE